jgi:hypothetical protein
LFSSFIDIVNHNFSLSTCDLHRKQVLDIQPHDNPSNRIRILGGRQLRRVLAAGEPMNQSRRRAQQASMIADYEYLLNVTFSCFGCEGKLFGATNFTSGLDCQCPADSQQFGVDEQDILQPLNGAMSELSISQSISDIIEVQRVPCSSTITEIAAMFTFTLALPTNGTIPNAEEVAATIVSTYNNITRRECDPYFRRISSYSPELLPNYTISKDGLYMNAQIMVNGTCRGENCTSFFDDPGKVASNATKWTSDSPCYCSVAAAITDL